LHQVLGETVVLSANGQGLATVALRPSGIFGEGDPLFVPVLIDKAAAGKMKYMIGNGRNVMDFTYVGNVAQAHIQVRCSTAGRLMPSGIVGVVKQAAGASACRIGCATCVSHHVRLPRSWWWGRQWQGGRTSSQTMSLAPSGSSWAMSARFVRLMQLACLLQ
jgi:3-beta hydroxysteroid dehydrogenase/isomerase family